MNTSVSNNIGHTTTAPATKKLALGATVNIPPRRLDFEFSTDSERYYYANNPYLISFFTTLSYLFTAGESFFGEAVRHYRERITDPV